MPIVKFKWTKEYEEKSCEDAPNYCREWTYSVKFKISTIVVGKVFRVGLTGKFQGCIYDEKDIRYVTLEPVRDLLSEAKKDVEDCFKRH